MKMEPWLGDQLITASKVEIRVNAEDKERANALVTETSAVRSVEDDQQFTVARRAAAQLKSMLDEIELDRKHVKQPFAAVARGIDDLAHTIGEEVMREQQRILKLLAVYVERLEAAKREEDQRKAELQRKAQEYADQKVREAQEAQRKAEMELRAAKDEIDRAKLKAEAQKRENQLLQQQLERELADEIIVDEEPQKGLVPGGRVNHTYEFELVNVQATTDARCFRLLRWELDIRACQDSVRNQLELSPDQEPTLPGIKITKRLNVSVKAASRIK